MRHGGQVDHSTGSSHGAVHARSVCDVAGQLLIGLRHGTTMAQRARPPPPLPKDEKYPPANDARGAGDEDRVGQRQSGEPNR
jgi:hypothetical protein